MLEGNEVDKKFDNGAGEAVVDVDVKGGVKLSASYNKDVDGYVAITSSVAVETNIFRIAEKIAAKTKVTWDDAAVKGLEQLLGLAAAVEQQAPVAP